MIQPIDIPQSPIEIDELTRENLTNSAYWQFNTDTFPLVISSLIEAREDALEVFRLIVALVQFECPGVDEWLPAFNEAYQTLQTWDYNKSIQDETGAGTGMLEPVRNFLKTLYEQQPDSKSRYTAYNLMEGLELAWGSRDQTL